MPTLAARGRLPGRAPAQTGPVVDIPPPSTLYAAGMPPQPAVDRNPGTFATTVAQPAPYNPPPVPSSGAPTFSPFGGQAPTPTAYGDFTAPNPLNFQQDPSYQFRFNEGQKALQRGAASRGTLLSGGFQKALQNYGQQAASQEYGNAFDRALAGYTTNRDTNAQNYGQLMGQFRGNLDAWGANSQGQLDYARLAQDAQNAQYNRQYQQSQDQRDYRQQVNNANAAQANAAADDYARTIAEQRAAAAAQQAENDRILRESRQPRPKPRGDLANPRPRHTSGG